MKINELSAEGLTRSYKVVIAAKDVESKVRSELEGLKDKVTIKGFRPGKTPVSVLEKMHGKAVRGQVLERMVNESAEKVFKEKKIQPVTAPHVHNLKFERDKDVEFELEIQVLPEIKIPDFSKFKLERLKAKVDDAAVNEIIDGLLKQHKSFKDAPKGAAAKKGDAVVIDFIGKVDDKPFEGAEAEDYQLELGSGSFVPGFEDQLVGARAGDEKTVKVTFPKDYDHDKVAGKKTEFEVKVKAIKTPVATKADDTFAKSLGFDDLKALKQSITKQITDDNQALSRALAKRKLLDKLADAAKFDVPKGMVDQEYGQIWERIKEDMVMSGEVKAEDIKGQMEPTEESDRAEFRAIAERRVRLGLLLAEIGRVNDVQVSPDEISKQILFEAQKYPGQEQKVFDYYRSSPQAAESARAPVYEDKVVDLIFSKAEVSEKTITTDELKKAYQKMEEEDEQGAVKETKPSKKKPAKKTAPKKTSTKKTAPKKAPAKKPAAKKVPTKKAPAKKK